MGSMIIITTINRVTGMMNNKMEMNWFGFCCIVHAGMRRAFYE